MPHLRMVHATYRLQFGPAFTFHDAQALLDYLVDLGISDCYASPIFQARTGSTHGYDICDHSQISLALGGAEAFDAFAAALRTHDMGLILDVVPNHMGIGDSCNGWWQDVLENGPGSVYAAYFDIDWHPVRPQLENKVLLPILEDQYGNVLERGKLRLAYENGAFFILYYDIALPVAPRTYSQILSFQLDELVADLGEEHEHIQELQSILTAIHYLPPRADLPPSKLVERNREKEIIKRRLAALEQASAAIRGAIDSTVQIFNGDVHDPGSFDLLDRLLDKQVYRPAFWRVAAEEINYRRFFDINELAAIRVELNEVFQATHQLVLRLLAEGKATGLRIDHPDGLWDPPGYFRRLQERYLEVVGDGAGAKGDREQCSAQPPDPSPHPPRALYVVAEKILADGEALPEDWAVAGTTGYDFLNAVNGLFVDHSNADVFTAIYSQFIGVETTFHNLTNSTKKMIMLVSLASEISELSQQLERIAERNRRYRDFTLGSLTFAIREVIACLPIYRTYITHPANVSARDHAAIERAVAEARRRNPRTAAAIFDFIRDTLLLRNVDTFPAEDLVRLTDFVMKFQQISGPVMAKGVEDTAFYVYNRLVSLNEVGGHPERFGSSVDDFHRQNGERRARWPHAMLATATHDTKRGEDVRARINVLSELPDLWLPALARWRERNAGKKTNLDGEPAPDRNDEYLLYQTLIGAWPFELIRDERPKTSGDENHHLSFLLAPSSDFVNRIAAYMEKATKEAKVHTSWVNPNAGYDTAVRAFVSGVLDDQEFLGDLAALLRPVAYYGQFNALAQTLLKLTSPGVPDIYQGTELWDFSLVDPDNRRPVDFALRSALLAALKDRIEQAGDDLRPLARELLNSSHDGRIKLYLTARALTFRRAHADVFSQGTYLPLEAHGPRRDHVCAFARTIGRTTAIVVAPRLVVRLTQGDERPPIGEEVWRDTWLTLPAEDVGMRYRNLFTGEVLTSEAHAGGARIPLTKVCRHFPAGLLTSL